MLRTNPFSRPNPSRKSGASRKRGSDSSGSLSSSRYDASESIELTRCRPCDVSSSSSVIPSPDMECSED